MSWFSQTYALVDFILPFANIGKLYAWSSILGLTPADVCSRPVMMPKSCLSASRLPTCSSSPCGRPAVSCCVLNYCPAVMVNRWSRWHSGCEAREKKTKTLLVQPHSGLFLVNFGLLVRNMWNLLDYFDASALFVYSCFCVNLQTRNRNRSWAVMCSFTSEG